MKCHRAGLDAWLKMVGVFPASAWVPMAEGMLAQRLGLTIPQATAVLIGEAARTGRTLHEIAHAIVYDGFRVGAL